MLFVSNPKLAEMTFAYLARLIIGEKLKIVYFDLILRKPAGLVGKLAAKLRKKLLTAPDLFICIHKDTTGYAQYFGVEKSKCVYVPFKANNFDLLGEFISVDGDYVLSLGASHRDYKLLVDAVRGLPINLKIVLPLANIKVHNANIAGIELPPNVEHIAEPVGRHRWSKYMAESRFVVVPLLPGVLQPAGISVYLEAMALGKAVIVSRSSSTEGILTDELALVVAAGDVAAMRSAVERLWNDSELRTRIAQAGRDYALSLGDHSRLLQDIRNTLDKYSINAM